MFHAQPYVEGRIKPFVSCLDTQSHDGVDDVVIVLLQSFDGLIAADVGLGHDQLNILVLQALGIDLLLIIVVLILIIVIVIVLLSLAGLDGLAGLAVVVARVVLGTGGGELGSGGLLSGSVDVLDLGLTEHTVQRQTGRQGAGVDATHM